ARYADRRNVEIVQADVLTVSLGSLAGESFKLIGNVPYYITTPILFHALVSPLPTRAVFLVQREVAERLRATPGGGDYGALSVNVQAVARVEQLFRIAPGSFSPPPTVESALVRVTPRKDPVVSSGEEAAYRRFVQAAFAQRRKQLRAIIRSISHLNTAAAGDLVAAAGFDPAARPETLTPAAFAALYRALTRVGGGR
ncbi:MAG TPA: rRNA adenine dimethyltransferase family protein, partial [Gemmatimonadaceae bacterium]|nr:rRNA adenine dimethyltransferase family protein [Gemmatimonadaceae bacterium]